ncbi:pilus assembly protein [Desulfobacter sp. UBA2225]|uniref:pilus assembly protein n=1 Tax=Desulfobacter sp. UBA2225 TaxID=1961413 RepID=UPI0025800400|nr:hypothetical protein [Desulfobacter sp. UBA2225]
MKTKLLLLLGLIAWTSFALAEDVDIYGVSNIEVKPNVLIILDNSGSMATKDVPSNQNDDYDPATIYSGSYEKNKVYYKYYGSWQLYFSDITSPYWQCSVAKTDLLSKGYWTGRLYKNYQNKVTCSSNGTSRDYALGNYLNFAGGGADRSRMEVAKEVVANLIIDNNENVNFGLMAFNYEHGGKVVANCGATQATLVGTYDPATSAMADSAQSAYGAVGLLKSDTWTPLAETLAEAGLYFAGKASWFNSGITYTSPIEYRCQKTYIILVTDGEPTKDDDKFASKKYIIDSYLSDSHTDTYNSSGYDYDMNQSHYSFLDDVANFLKHTDVLSDLGKTGDFEDQTITTYTIGFQTAQDLLSLTATRGGGEYYQATNAGELGVALNSIIVAIKEQNEIFTAAAVPVSRANKAYAGNYVYYGMFQPTNTGNWYGNLKKYGITDDGVIQDKNGIAIESGGTVVDNAVSYWSNAADGPKVTAGGAGEVLQDRATDRDIYTYTGTTSDLTALSNKFSTDNSTTLNTYTDLTDTVIDAVRIGVADDWPLGSLLHSQPIVVHYDTNNDGTEDHSMIYAGANDGMLHCFDDEDGKELWGFIPQDLLGNLSSKVGSSGLEYFVDGTPVYYHYDHDNSSSTQDKKLLIFGERRGGKHYTALDISSYSAPAFKYSITPDILGTEELGQSWTDPQALQMGHMDGATYKTRDVFLMAGGYDINQDLLPTGTPAINATDSMGRAVYTVDAQTGTLFSNFLFSHDNYSAMTHSIIAVSGFENPKTRTTTRVYAGDMNGNLFAFRDDIFHRNTSISKASAFDGKYDGQEDGVWGQRLKLYALPGKKIFYAPTILNEYFPVEFTYEAGEKSDKEETVLEKRVGDYAFFGTGDREHPERTDILNGFYAIKNNWQWSSESPVIVEAYVDKTDGKVKAKNDGHTVVGGEDDPDELFLLDVTDDLLQNEEADSDVSLRYTNYVKSAIDHENNRGWFILLKEANGSQVGEKVVSSPLIYDGVIYFSTYVPDDDDEDNSDDPCAVSGAGGNGYLYALGYKYGEAAINYDTDNDDGEEKVLGRQDRRKKLKNKGIPPQPVLVVHEGKPTIIIGFETTDPIAPVGLERAFWRQLNK